jgi:hypothetical protein
MMSDSTMTPSWIQDTISTRSRESTKAVRGVAQLVSNNSSHGDAGIDSCRTLSHLRVSCGGQWRPTGRVGQREAVRVVETQTGRGRRL